MLKFKGLREPVALEFPTPGLWKILQQASIWSNRNGYDVVIHSIHDHTHAKASLHYESLAVDFQVRFANGKPNRAAMSQLATWLRGTLPSGFDTVWDVPHHKNHVHCECDFRARPRKN